MWNCFKFLGKLINFTWWYGNFTVVTNEDTKEGAVWTLCCHIMINTSQANTKITWYAPNFDRTQYMHKAVHNGDSENKCKNMFCNQGKK